jgi:hypothetical protein
VPPEKTQDNGTTNEIEAMQDRLNKQAYNLCQDKKHNHPFNIIQKAVKSL